MRRTRWNLKRAPSAAIESSCPSGRGFREHIKCTSDTLAAKSGVFQRWNSKRAPSLASSDTMAAHSCADSVSPNILLDNPRNAQDSSQKHPRSARDGSQKKVFRDDAVSSCSGTMRAASPAPSSIPSGTMVARSRCASVTVAHSLRRKPAVASVALCNGSAARSVDGCSSTAASGTMAKCRQSSTRNVSVAHSISRKPAAASVAKCSGSADRTVSRCNAAIYASACLTLNKAQNASQMHSGGSRGGSVKVSFAAAQAQRAILPRPNRKIVAPPASPADLAWSSSAIEAAARYRAAAASVEWICSPLLLKGGIRCQKCPRLWMGSKAQTSPGRFCRSSPCHACSTPPPDAGARARILTQKGLLRSKQQRHNLAISRAPHMDIEVTNSKFHSWSCPLCDFALPPGVANPAYMTR